MSLSNDTRKIGLREPLGVKDNLRKKLEDGVAYSIAQTLANSTSSNYNKNEGSNVRVIYEGLGALLSSMLVDSMDLLEDALFEDLRPEFIADRLASSFFRDVNEIPSYNGDKDFRNMILALIEALIQGSSEAPITELLNKRVDYQQPRITQTGLHTIEVLLFSFGLTTKPTNNTLGVADHLHMILAPKKGMGATSTQLDYVWGDEFHVHEVVDGVVQPANGHTHDVSYGLTSNAVKYQQDVARLLKLTKPAHVWFADPSSLVQEDNLDLTDEIDWSMSLSFQDDLRKVSPGLKMDSVIRAYLSYRTIFINPSFYSFKRGMQFKLLSDVTLMNPEEYTRSITSEAILLKPDIGELTLNCYRDNSQYVFDFDEFGRADIQGNIREGDLLVTEFDANVRTNAFYVHILDNNRFVAQSFIHSLNAPILPANNLYYAYPLNLTWKTIPAPTRTHTISFFGSNSNPLVSPFQIPNIFEGTTILNLDIKVYLTREGSTSELGVVDCYNSILDMGGFQFEEGDLVTITAPYSEEFTELTMRLNQPLFKLNRGRLRRQREISTGEYQGLGFKKGNESASYVLNRSLYHNPYTHEYSEAKIMYVGSSILNQSNFKLNNTKSLLNKSEIADQVYRVTSNAVVNVVVPATNFLSNLQLGFRPTRLVSLYEVGFPSVKIPATILTDGLKLGVNCIGKTLRVEAYTRRSLTQEGDWFVGQSLNEGQTALRNPATTKEEVGIEEIKANPAGYTLDGESDEARSLPVKVVETNNSGEKGEFYLFQDHLSLSLSGTRFSEVSLLEVESSCDNVLILGGGGGFVIPPLVSFFSGDSTLDERNVMYRGGGVLADNGVEVCIYWMGDDEAKGTVLSI